MSQKSEAASHAYWEVVWHRGTAVGQRRTVMFSIRRHHATVYIISISIFCANNFRFLWCNKVYFHTQPPKFDNLHFSWRRSSTLLLTSGKPNISARRSTQEDREFHTHRWDNLNSLYARSQTECTKVLSSSVKPVLNGPCIKRNLP
jgi:hypothetical protein